MCVVTPQLNVAEEGQGMKELFISKLLAKLRKVRLIDHVFSSNAEDQKNYFKCGLVFFRTETCKSMQIQNG